MRDWAHRLKRRVIRRPSLRHHLRRWLVTPFQLRELRRLVRVLPPPPQAGDGPHVVVLALRPWAISRAWEVVFTRLLAGEGCRVTWVIDDRTLLRCDAMGLGPRDLALCDHCIRFNRRIAAVAGVEAVPLGRFLPPAEPPRAAGPEVDAGWGGDVVRASFQRLLAGRPAPPDRMPPGERRVLDELTASAERVAAAADGLFAALCPDAVLALNGKFFAERVLLDRARRRGVPVWTYERGNRRDTVVLARAPHAVPFDPTPVLARLDRPLADDERRRLDDYLRRRVELGNGQVRFLAAGGGDPWGPRRQGSRRLALFTNLVWDSAVVGEDTVFTDMFDWLRTTVAAAGEHPDLELVVRVHPAEEKVYWHPTRDRVADFLAAEMPGGLPPNVRLAGPAEPVDSYALMRGADRVLVYTSTVGLEAAALGRRVVVAARSSYSRAPFVVRPADRGAYLRELVAGPVAPPVADAAELARRFLYRLYFEEMLEVPAVREDPTGFHVEPGRREQAALARRLALLAADARRHAGGAARERGAS